MMQRQELLESAGRKLGQARVRLEHVRLKAEHEDKHDTWLENALRKEQEVSRLVDELRAAPDTEFQERRPILETAVDTLEVMLVRAAENLGEDAELDLKGPNAEAASPPIGDEPHDTGEVQSTRSATPAPKKTHL